MSCHADCYTRTPSLRVRPVPELGCCLVFTPDRPNLYSLNAKAWLVLELCRGQSSAALEAAYREALEEQGIADEAGGLGGILLDLERKGILQRSIEEEA